MPDLARRTLLGAGAALLGALDSSLAQAQQPAPRRGGALVYAQMSGNRRGGDELLNGEVFNTLREAQVLIEEWRRHYNRVRPHSSLGYRPLAPETVPMARSHISSGTGAAAMPH